MSRYVTVVVRELSEQYMLVPGTDEHEHRYVEIVNAHNYELDEIEKVDAQSIPVEIFMKDGSVHSFFNVESVHVDKESDVA